MSQHLPVPHDNQSGIPRLPNMQNKPPAPDFPAVLSVTYQISDEIRSSIVLPISPNRFTHKIVKIY